MKKKNFLIGIVILLLWIIACFNFRLTIINGYSMEDTLKENGFHISTIHTDEIQRNDIVIVDVQDIVGEIIIKRVIAIPGDTIEIKDNVIYLNGIILEEDYLKEPMQTADICVTLGKDEYFICGDNRNNSLDSRSEIIGIIRKKQILYKLIW